MTFLVGLLMLGGSEAGAAAGPVVNQPKYGFAFTLPPGWTKVPLNGTDITALLNSAAHDNPTLANALKGEVTGAATKGIKVYAVGSISGGTLPTINVAVASSAGAPTGNQFAPAMVPQAKIGLAEIGTAHAKTFVVHNRLGTVAQATYQLNLKGMPPQYGVQFYALHKSHIEVISVTTSSASSSKADAQVIVNSWRWL